MGVMVSGFGMCRHYGGDGGCLGENLLCGIGDHFGGHVAVGFERALVFIDGQAEEQVECGVL